MGAVGLDYLLSSYSLYIKQNKHGFAGLFLLVCCSFCPHLIRGYEIYYLAIFTNLNAFPFSYSDILIEREVLMQKYIHLVQIVETEKIAANQLRHQLEDQDTEIERLKSEVCARVIKQLLNCNIFLCALQY